LERLRWGDGFSCRFCGAVDGGWWRMSDGLRRCAACRSETSVTAGTIFAGTRTPLVSWFAAIGYVVNQKQGVSALGLQRVLGLGSYETAWAWLHKLRRAMVLPGRELLAGAVEVGESYIGARRTGAARRGVTGKPIVAIAVENRGAASGRVRMRRIPDVTKATLTDFVLETLPAAPRCPRWLAGLLRHRPLPLQARGHQRFGLRRPRACRPAARTSRRCCSAGSWAPTKGAISHHQLDYSYGGMVVK
jgi:ISXO2-like transposase domain/Transposase zinc-ribbon domain